MKKDESDLDFAYQTGRRDFAKGLRRADNPYRYGSDAGLRWSKGWDDADEEKWAEFQAGRAAMNENGSETQPSPEKAEALP